LRQVPFPLQVPSFPQVLAPPSVHWVAGFGSWPAGTLAQFPTLPVTAQDLHVPVQAVAQHTPCAQNVELHSAPAVHVAPFGFFPQLPVMQVFGDTQSVVVVQSTRHALLVPHWYGSQPEESAGRQRPAPSHVREVVRVDPTQVAAAHSVPATCWRQPPAPLQLPSLPQAEAAVAGHWVAGTGGIPAGIGEQVPTVPVRLQDSQVPPHALLQHTPW
jgi:hypothetical protein